MDVAERDREIAELTRQIEELKAKLSDARRRREPEPVADYELHRQGGAPIRLSELFGDQRDLILIHNMGRGCAYCTMWADGFTGVLPHLQDRAAFVVVSPDPPEVQREFAAARGWTFPMASAAGSSFIRDMGFEIGDEGNPDYWPGLSAFHRLEDGSIVRTGLDVFGPGDDYSPPWRMFDLLCGGAGDWEPRFSYA